MRSNVWEWEFKELSEFRAWAKDWYFDCWEELTFGLCWVDSARAGANCINYSSVRRREWVAEE